VASTLDELLAAFKALPAEKQAEAAEDAASVVSHFKWMPNPGPQTDAYFSQANVLLYGGQGGGGKSDLGLGLAFTAHERSLVLRREYTNLGALIDRTLAINGSRSGFNGSPPPRLTFARESRQCIIDFGANQHLGDEQKWQGQPYDLKYFDEATQFLELQVRFHLGWLRNATSPGQRVRAVLGTNPPVNSDGDWIIGMFRPWLDLTHPKPAAHGELRWFVTDDAGNDLEVPESDLNFDGVKRRHKTLTAPDGRPLEALSRTFIPAKLSDNPYLINTDYQAQLDALPEPVRSAVRDGNFMAMRADSDRQVIPTQWIIEAQARWTSRPPEGEAMVAVAADIAQGGADNTVISYRHKGWFGPQVVKPGSDTPDGASVVALLMSVRRDGAEVVLDMGGGYGGATSERLNDNGIPHIRFNGAGASTRRTKDGALGFVNRRAEAYWMMREELDPEQEGGSPIALPPDPELRSQLAAATYKVTTRGIQVEAKDDIKKRLGSSPDKADSAVMCLAEGKRSEVRMKRRAGFEMQRQTTANVGHSGVKGYYRR